MGDYSVDEARRPGVPALSGASAAPCTGPRETSRLRESRRALAYLREPKPQKLLDLHDASARLFALLRESFEVPMRHTLVLDSVDSARHDLRRTHDIAAVTMRKVQALRLVTIPGELTRSDIVICLIAELAISLETLAIRLIGDSGNDEGRSDDLFVRRREQAGILIELRNRINEAGRHVMLLGDGEIVELI